MIKLNLASGDRYIENYINIDNQSMSSNKVDIKADITTLKWQNNSVDEILLSHFMMYLEPEKALQLFKRWFGWLKEDGQIIIENGDIKKVAKIILESNDPDIINGFNGLKQIFGWKETKGHKWAWCEENITPLLVQAGFTLLSITDGIIHHNPERDFLITAAKKTK